MIALPISLRTWHLAGAVLLALPQVVAAQASPPWVAQVRFWLRLAQSVLEEVRS